MVHLAGPLYLHLYTVMIAAGVIAGILIVRQLALEFSVSPDAVLLGGLISVLGSLVGGHLASLILMNQFHPSEWKHVFYFWEGLTSLGMVIGAFATALIFMLVMRLPYLKLFDVIGIAGFFTIGFARIGCFLNGCCYGIETHLPWAIKAGHPEHWVHPTQIYESLTSFIFGVIAFIVWKSRKLPAGIIGCGFMILYSLMRFHVDFLRHDHKAVFLFLSAIQWFALICVFTAFLTALGIWIYDSKRNYRSS